MTEWKFEQFLKSAQFENIVSAAEQEGISAEGGLSSLDQTTVLASLIHLRQIEKANSLVQTWKNPLAQNGLYHFFSGRLASEVGKEFSRDMAAAFNDFFLLPAHPFIRGYVFFQIGFLNNQLQRFDLSLPFFEIAEKYFSGLQLGYYLFICHFNQAISALNLNLYEKFLVARERTHEYLLTCDSHERHRVVELAVGLCLHLEEFSQAIQFLKQENTPLNERLHCALIFAEHKLKLPCSSLREKRVTEVNSILELFLVVLNNDSVRKLTRKDFNEILPQLAQHLSNPYLLLLCDLILEKTSDSDLPRILRYLRTHVLLRRPSLALADFAPYEIESLLLLNQIEEAKERWLTYKSVALATNSKNKLLRADRLHEKIEKRETAPLHLVVDESSKAIKVGDRQYDLSKHETIFHFLCFLVKKKGRTDFQDLNLYLYQRDFNPVFDEKRINSLIHRTRRLTRLGNHILRKNFFLTLSKNLHYEIKNSRNPTAPERQTKILKLLAQSMLQQGRQQEAFREMDMRQLLNATGFPLRTLQKDLTALIDSGKVVKKGKGKATRYYPVNNDPAGR